MRTCVCLRFIAGKDYYCGKFELPESRVKYELLLSEYLANKHSFSNSKARLLESVVLSYLEYAQETYDSREVNNIKLVTRALLKHYGELPADNFVPTQF